MGASLFDLFWENSKLGPVTVRGFRRRIDDYGATERERDDLQYAGAAVPLARPRDSLARLLASRRSERAFAERPLSPRRLGALLSCFADTPSGGRAIPSAGGTYPLEIFALLPNVAGPLGGKAIHYDPRSHGATVVAELPGWDACTGAVNAEGFVGIPQVVVVFVLFPERATAKYGERGGRFALIEVGHAAQNLALRLARSGMAGCELGGLLDEQVKALLRLDGTRAQIALGYACGLRPRRAGRT